MKKVLNLFAILGLVLLFTAASYSQDIQQVKKKVMQANNRMAKALMEMDKQTLMSLYTDDAVSLPNYGPMLKGKSSIKDQGEKDMNSGMKFSAVDFKTVDLFADGDYAYEIGTYDMTFTMPNSTTEVNDKGKYLTVWEEQNDGSWKIKAETWNADSMPNMQ